MDENKPLRTYAEEEVSEDPLVVLSCGHVLPMSSMDGFLELHKAYAVDAAGNWSHPQQLMVTLAFLSWVRHPCEMRTVRCRQS